MRICEGTNQHSRPKETRRLLAPHGPRQPRWLRHLAHTGKVFFAVLAVTASNLERRYDKNQAHPQDSDSFRCTCVRIHLSTSSHDGQ